MRETALALLLVLAGCCHRSPTVARVPARPTVASPAPASSTPPVPFSARDRGAPFPMTRVGGMASHRAHNSDQAGSTPAPATTLCCEGGCCSIPEAR